MVRILILQDDRSLKQKFKDVWEETKDLWFLFINSSLGYKFKKALLILIALTLAIISACVAIS